jgi:hypothetical protein
MQPWANASQKGGGGGMQPWANASQKGGGGGMQPWTNANVKNAEIRVRGVREGETMGGLPDQGER